MSDLYEVDPGALQMSGYLKLTLRSELHAVGLLTFAEGAVGYQYSVVDAQASNGDDKNYATKRSLSRSRNDR